MNTKWATMLVVALAGLGMETTTASASDLSRFLEHSRINVAYGRGAGYSNYGGYRTNYGPQYVPQYVPQYPPQYGGYAPVPQNGYYPPQPGYQPPVPAPLYDDSIGIGFGYGYNGQVPNPQWRGGGHCHHDDHSCHHRHHCDDDYRGF